MLLTWSLWACGYLCSIKITDGLFGISKTDFSGCDFNFLSSKSKHLSLFSLLCILMILVGILIGNHYTPPPFEKCISLHELFWMNVDLEPSPKG